MEEQKKSQISLKQKQELINILDAMFPEQHIDIEGTSGNIKAELTFSSMLNDNWKVEEFEQVISEFVKTWTYQNWLPANILQIREKNKTKMVM